MKNSGVSLVAAVVTGTLLVYGLIEGGAFSVVLHDTAVDMAAIAERINIRNLVSMVYLGPRIFDTTLEVLVVILTVFGMKAVRGKE